MLLLLASWVLHAMALMVVGFVLPGVEFEGFLGALVAALLLGLVNALIKPVLALLTLPLTVLTLGLFYVFLNGLMFYWVGSMLPGFQVDGVWSAIFASILYSIVAFVLMGLFLRPEVKIEKTM